MTNRIRVFLAVEAAAFFLAASVHAGLTLHGFEHQKACIAETVIGVVLAAGLLFSLLAGRATRVVGVTVQAFALLGTLVGVFTIVIGIGPRTIPDYLFHAGILIVLGVGLRIAVTSSGQPPSSQKTA
ncbi:MAG: hypothetical protein ACM3JB_22645 [Acidobacteriaceae bacterium]